MPNQIPQHQTGRISKPGYIRITLSLTPEEAGQLDILAEYLGMPTAAHVAKIIAKAAARIPPEQFLTRLSDFSR